MSSYWKLTVLVWTEVHLKLKKRTLLPAPSWTALHLLRLEEKYGNTKTELWKPHSRSRLWIVLKRIKEARWQLGHSGRYKSTALNWRGILHGDKECPERKQRSGQGANFLLLFMQPLQSTSMPLRSFWRNLRSQKSRDENDHEAEWSRGSTATDASCEFLSSSSYSETTWKLAVPVWNEVHVKLKMNNILPAPT